MSNDIFDLEQQLLDCWKVTDDIDMVTKHFIDGPKWAAMDAELADAIMNKYFAIKELYEIKFESLWHTFDEVSKEYHQYRKLSGDE